MNTIKDSIENEIIIKNSRFIAILRKVHHKDQVTTYLKEARLKYPKASHYCYAYIIDQDKKSSDDQEPSGTAGIPILGLLEKENLNYVLAIVVRYFGGIKLGTGGLVRAYTKSVKESLKNTVTIPLIDGYLIKIITDYGNQRDLEYLLRDDMIIQKEFLEKVTYQVMIQKSTLELLNSYSYEIVKIILIEKEKIQ